MLALYLKLPSQMALALHELLLLSQPVQVAIVVLLSHGVSITNRGTQSFHALSYALPLTGTRALLETEKYARLKAFSSGGASRRMCSLLPYRTLRRRSVLLDSSALFGLGFALYSLLCLGESTSGVELSYLTAFGKR